MDLPSFIMSWEIYFPLFCRYSIPCRKLQPDDLFLLCSDGLTDMLTDERINATIELEDSLENKAQGLIDQANEAGGYDNITLALVQVIAE